MIETHATTGFNITCGNVDIGTTDPHGYMLAVNGSAIATSMTVKLSANWPDCVFKNDYSLGLCRAKSSFDGNSFLTANSQRRAEPGGDEQTADEESGGTDALPE